MLSRPNSPKGLGCIKGLKEIKFNEDVNNYYYYDIQGQRKSLMGEGDSQTLNKLCRWWIIL